MAVNDVLINMLAFSASPGMFLYMIIALAIMSFFIYIFIRFFSKNRFRGISLGIFSKTIYLNDYIEKFNSELFMDFDNIATYNEKNIQFLYKGDILSDITAFMKSIKSNRDTFNLVMFSFFEPNNSFITNALDPNTDETAKSIAQLKRIMEKLYKDDFHDAFGTWINYNSIWNFINKDSTVLLNTLVFNYIADDHFTLTQHDAKANYVIYYNKLKAIKNSKGTPTELFKQLLLSDDIVALGDVVRQTLKDEFARSLGLNEKHTNAIDNIMFVGPTNNAKNDGNISQDTNTDKYCALDEDKLKLNQTIDVASKMGISVEMIDDLNKSLSFIDTLTVLSKRDYNVSNGMFDSSVNNLHKVILEAVEKASKKDNKQEKYMLVHNACYTLFNEFLYFKYQKDGKNVFLFHDNKETVDESIMKTRAIWKLCHLFFNLHLMNCFKSQVSNAISFMDDNKEVFKKQIDFITDTHVSIARLKYLVQDYFIVIQQYNDKQYPNKQEIKNFWEKRVNAFGYIVTDTKDNKPQNVPESEYGKAKVNRERSENMWEADTDYVLYKNTPFALYSEYLNAVLMQFRHPRIPFFQSIMGMIRYMIPPPNVLLDNFMNQIKGIPAVKTTSTNPEYDFSFQYNPYYNGLGVGVDKFESLEDSAVRMTSTINLSTHGSKILTAAEVTQETIDAKNNEALPNMDAANASADSTSRQGGGVNDGQGEAPKQSVKNRVANEAKKNVNKAVGKIGSVAKKFGKKFGTRFGKR